MSEQPHPGTTGGAKNKKLRVSGIMDPRTIAKFHELIGAPEYGMIYDKTWIYLGKWLGFLSGFNHTKTQVRTFQRRIGMSYPDVTGSWYDEESKTFDPKTVKALQQYLNENQA